METNERGPLPSLCNWQKHSSWPTPGDHHLGYRDLSAFPVPEVYRTEDRWRKSDRSLSLWILALFLSKGQSLLSLAAYSNSQHTLTTDVWRSLTLGAVGAEEEFGSDAYLFVEAKCDRLVPQCHEEISSVHLILQMGHNHVNYQTTSKENNFNIHSN